MALSFARCPKKLFLPLHVATLFSGFAACCKQQTPMTVLERPLAHLKFSNLIEGGGYNELKKMIDSVTFTWYISYIWEIRKEGRLTCRSYIVLRNSVYEYICISYYKKKPVIPARFLKSLSSQNLGYTHVCVRLRCGLIGGLACMESLLLRHGRWFSPNAAAEFERAYLCYRSAINQLADHACSHRRLRYHMRPKIHMLGHIVYHFLPRNPRYYMCFLDEDFISRVKNVAAVSHPLHTSRLSLLRYVIHACMAWAAEGSTVWGGSEKGRFDSMG